MSTGARGRRTVAALPSTKQYTETSLAAYNCNPGGGFSKEEEIFACDEIFGCEEESPACSQDDEELGFCESPVSATEPPRGGRVPRDRKNGPQCGRRNPEGTASIQSLPVSPGSLLTCRPGAQVQPAADEAEFGEWPHVCAILKKEYIGNVSRRFTALRPLLLPMWSHGTYQAANHMHSG
jgi:hypothetical protein